MRDLLVTAHTPVLRSGRALRTYGIARALADPAGLDLLYARFEGAEPDAAFRAIPGIELHEVVPSRGAQRLFAYARSRLAGVPAGFARGASPELAAQAIRLAAAPGRGRVIADGPVVAAALIRGARGLPVVYNAHNFESGFRGELDGGGPRTDRVLRRFERHLLAHASESWMVSEADLSNAHELCPAAHLRLVPNVVDVAAIEPVRTPSSEPRAIFVANFAYAPNRHGLRFLLGEVLPRVWSELPEARLELVGAGLQSAALDAPPTDAPSTPPTDAPSRDAPSTDAALELRELLDDPRIEVSGFVEDLHAAYARSRCALVPLLQGGGTPLKLIEALAHGLPVIATPRAVAGLDVLDGEHCLVVDGAAPFAAALLQVLRDGAPELGRRGRELVAARYSIEALRPLVAA